ncbi:thioredoxin fold domain-containing protein [Myroides sp. 1354]|uniref:thioredoxin family protein n=1 Tax=unclassified Myroides TaxID=2642485 RepID=UPI00257682BB|nr:MULTISPECIES: thioredoxin domain-containing protein [unclassified Myroides]MDM1044531.1 thioredoxin fold domain-containing protein [Myroides sp. R163-1]MDM1056768.1 thioredoxin fold domain-containing protein [Myroides sp. 1354]MDM1069961.1 thioredoxin fold domain-containing protein [Myroides sp. 1372]
MKVDDLLGKTDKPILLQFFAEWCGPCKMLSRMIDESYDMVTEKVELQRIDVDHDSQLAAEFFVRAVPTMVLIDQQGVILWRHTGVLPVPEILKQVNL